MLVSLFLSSCRLFPENIAKFLRKPCFVEHLRKMILIFVFHASIMSSKKYFLELLELQLRI